MTERGLGVLGILLGSSGGTAASRTRLGSQLGGNAAFMKFSRGDERQADKLGIHNL